MDFKRLLITLSALFVTTTAMAGDDFGLWGDISVEKKIDKKLSLDAGLGFRAEENASRASRYDASVGATYKFLKWFRMSAGYVYLYSRSPREVKTKYQENNDGSLKLDNEGQPIYDGYNVDHAYYRSKHRLYLDAVGKVKAGRFEFSLRERYQFTHYMAASTTRDRYRMETQPDGTKEVEFSKSVTDEKRAKDRHYLRSRLQVTYDIPKCPLEPFVSCELSNDLSDKLYLDKTRLGAGADWKITKQHKLGLSYLYENGSDDDEGNGLHAVEVSYKFSF